MQDCYGWLDGQPWYESEFRTWTDAFKPFSNIVFEEHVDGEWISWPVEVPTNHGVPGDGGELPSVWEFVQRILDWMLERVEGSHLPAAATPAHGPLPADTPAWLHRMAGDVVDTDRPDPGEGAKLAVEVRALHAALRIARRLPVDPREHTADHHRGILWLLEKFMGWLLRELGEEVEKHDASRRLWMMLDFAFTCVKGLIEDGVVVHGFDHVNDIEWSDWLRKHGASASTMNSPFVRGVYDYVFGYRGGDPDHPDIEAGTCMHGLYRLLVTYKGAIFWKMQAGMGDTVFSPLYLYLKAKGVKFEFFRKVENLGLSADGRHVETIRMEKQVTLLVDEYDPLAQVRNVPSWPSEPRWETEIDGRKVLQIAEAEDLRGGKVDLESSWSPWKGVGHEELKRGEQFHQVVLGISLAGLKDVCSELIEGPHANAGFAAMCRQVETVQTLALQLWLAKPAEDLGSISPGAALTAYAQPFNTWADMSHLDRREDWPAGHHPHSIAYFCGPLKDAKTIPPYSDHDFPRVEAAAVRESARRWLDENAGHLWPKIAPEAHPNGLEWSELVDLRDRSGEQRLDAQYWRANIDPSQRYVLSVTNSSRHRLPADGSGYENLFLVGDWVKTSINAGCVEAATMAGLVAARAITGTPVSIHGEHVPVAGGPA